MTFGFEEQPVEIPYVKMKGTKFGEVGPYPKWKYHAKDAPDGVIVEDADDEASLGSGWVDSPAAFGQETAPQMAPLEQKKRGPGRPRKVAAE